MNADNQTTLGEQFERALVFANRIHAGQRRKENGAPYLAHVIGVASLVLEDGGSETEAIAALLHDTAEDGGGQPTLDEISAQFGEQIAEIVHQCSDTLTSPKPPWRGRKEDHLAKMHIAIPEAQRVVLADKVYNARALLRILRENGPQVWDNFNGGRDGTLWYYRQMHELFCQQRPGYLAAELGRLILAIESLATD
jgi:(p)ppGpp synthase/HD superfamily hydrolase